MYCVLNNACVWCPLWFIAILLKAEEQTVFIITYSLGRSGSNLHRQGAEEEQQEA